MECHNCKTLIYVDSPFLLTSEPTNKKDFFGNDFYKSDNHKRTKYYFLKRGNDDYLCNECCNKKYKPNSYYDLYYQNDNYFWSPSKIKKKCNICKCLHVKHILIKKVQLYDSKSNALLKFKSFGYTPLINGFFYTNNNKDYTCEKCFIKNLANTNTTKSENPQIKLGYDLYFDLDNYTLYYEFVQSDILPICIECNKQHCVETEFFRNKDNFDNIIVKNNKYYIYPSEAYKENICHNSDYFSNDKITTTYDGPSGRRLFF